MKLKKIVSLLSSLTLIVLGGALTACTSDDSVSSSNIITGDIYSEGVIVGGENVADTELAYKIQNATDIHVRKNGNITSYTSKVVAVYGNDVKTVTVDNSKVDLTKSGCYELTYSYESAVKKVNVYVYETPTITDSKAGQDISTVYNNVYKDIFDGISASVVCGAETFTLDVKLKTQDFIRGDGSIDITNPTRTLTFMAEAPSGEVVTLTRNVVVTGGMQVPSIASAYSYDVFDDGLVITGLTQEELQSFLTVSIDENTIAPLVKVEEDTLVIDGQGLYELFGVSDEHTLRVVTSNGYAEASLEVVDQKPVLLDFTAVQNFVSAGKINGETYSLPVASKSNPRQTADINVRLTRKGETIANKIQDVLFQGIGTYTLEYTVRGVTSTFDFICYNDLGLQGNVTFTMAKKFDFTLSDEYTLLRYTVRQKDGIVAYYSATSDEYNDLNAFYQTVAGLNKSKVYQLEVYVNSANGIMSQTIDFTIGDDNIVEVLTGKNSLDLGRVTTHSTCSLEYIVANFGGRNGAFKWYFPTEKTGQTESLLHFSDEMATRMKAGTFVTFDIYCNSALNLSLYDAEDVTSFYSNGYKGEHSPKIAYYVDGVRYANLRDMNEIPGGYLNKWITIELELTRDFASAKGVDKFNNTWNGIFVLGNYNNLRDYNNFVANIKLSSYSFMQDTTENEVFEPRMESEGLGDDIWKD